MCNFVVVMYNFGQLGVIRCTLLDQLSDNCLTDSFNLNVAMFCCLYFPFTLCSNKLCCHHQSHSLPGAAQELSCDRPNQLVCEMSSINFIETKYMLTAYIGLHAAVNFERQLELLPSYTYIYSLATAAVLRSDHTSFQLANVVQANVGRT
jgi:hypothetical protein